MGTLREITSGRKSVLEPEHVVGRAPGCALLLNDKYVSGQHAALRWSGSHWEIKDLGSRNGTFLDGVRLMPGQEQRLRTGSRIAFGSLVEDQWELVDASPPSVMVVPLDGGEPVFLDGDLLALPSAQEPIVTLYRSEGAWFLERSDEALSPITSLQTFDVAGRSFRFCCPETVYRTSVAGPMMAGLFVEHLKLSFEVSADEEHVHLVMTWGGATHDMGTRGHNYLLLTLARRRLEDAADGVPEASSGWIYQEDLAHDPSMAPPQLNIDVFRIRRQFAAAGVVDAANIIERRPRTRQLRIGTGHISVARL